MIPSATNYTAPQAQPTSPPDPTLREFLVECLYPACLSIAGWIERKYKPERAAQRAAFDRWVKEQGR